MNTIFNLIDQIIRRLNYKRINLFRKIRLSILNFILSPISLFSGQSNLNQDILVFRLDDKLGDSVTATGFLRELKNNNPNSNLVVFCGSAAFKIYSNLKSIDHIYIIKKGLFSTIKAFFTAKKFKFKLILNTSHILTPQVMILSCFIRAIKKVTFLNSNVKIYSDFVEYHPDFDSVVMRYEKTMNLLGYFNLNLKYELNIEERDKVLAAQFLSKYKQQNKKIIVLNSFAGAKLRNFNFETTKAIVQKIISENENIIVVSLGNLGDQIILNFWQEKFNHPNWIVFKEATDLMLNIALLEQSDLVITPDTAWVHIAAALQKKLVCVYREDSTEKNSLIWAPYGTKYIQLFSDRQDINKIDPNSIAKKSIEFLFSCLL